MSYDLYCFKSKSGVPDLEEAQNAIEELGDENSILDDKLKEKLAKELRELNPKLERFIFDYNEIARLQNTTVDEARRSFNHIELTKAEGELAVQITIYNNNVSITVPFWYSGEKAKAVFNEVGDYTKLIGKATGFFVYDPQMEHVYDPHKSEFTGLKIYEQTTSGTQKNSGNATKKPWWKIW